MMAHLRLEGTPEQLTKQLATLPTQKRYQITEVDEGKPTPTQTAIDAANVLLRETISSSGKIEGYDNESIDRDLAAEYGKTHAGLYKSKEEI